MTEILKEKDTIIEMLTKEKNFYQKRSDQLSKQQQQQIQSTTINTQCPHNEMIEEIRAQIEKEMQVTIGKLQEVIKGQNQEISMFSQQKMEFQRTH